ncbi:MAG: DUF4880 domain-containing protein [Alphaproteobacteria bacterium]|nr:DUF4880 domain-containing protein [Alphaproteobacteria bacterium]
MSDKIANIIPKETQDAAVRWHVRLGDAAASEDDWLAFTDWLEQDGSHRLAYDAIEDILIDLDNAHIDDGEVSVERPASNVIDARHRWGGMRQWVTAAAAVAAMIMLVFGTREISKPEMAVQEYATAVGEQKLITLADGSMLRLNTNSKVRVMFEDKVRRTELAYGQVVYSVAKDAKRPFLVGLGDSQVHVVGTVFDILRHKNKVRVTVAEGVVDVVPATEKNTLPRREIVRLLPGAQLIHNEGTGNTNVTKVDPAVVMAWENGYLEYDEARLADVVDDLNRYFPTPIHVVGQARELRFSGVVRTTDEQDALLVLSEGLPVYIEKSNGEIFLKSGANGKEY